MYIENKIFRYFYGFSCFFFLTVSLTFIIKPKLFQYKYSYFIFILSLIQAIISYKADYQEYFKNIKYNLNLKKYNVIDRIIAIITFIFVILFVKNTKSNYRLDYFIYLFISLFIWKISLFLFKNKIKIWFWFHSFWHYIPIIAFIKFLLTLN